VQTVPLAMKFFAAIVVASLAVASSIMCHTGTLYSGSGCSGWTSTSASGDCGGSYDQCYTWTYNVAGGCNYQTKGCDTESSSWCGSAYQGQSTYTAACCDTDDCNADVDWGDAGSGSSGGSGGSDSDGASSSFMSVAVVTVAAVATM